MSRMLSDWQSVRRLGMTLEQSLEQSRYIKAYEHHRDALVSLEYFERMEFPLRHIGPGREDEWKALYLALNAEMRDSVENGYFTMGGYEPETAPLVVVWARPEERQKYEKIISTFDAVSPQP